MTPRIAIAHDYLTQFGGAERVVLSMAKAFPGAPIYTTLYAPESTYPEFKELDVRVSPLNRITPLQRFYRFAVPILPIASSALRIDADLVVASSSGWAHGFPTAGKKLVYCHSPARWVYFPDQYFGQHAALRRIAAPLRGPLRFWDQRAAGTADQYLANSRLVQTRVAEAYGIDAQLLHAPHSMSADAPRRKPPIVEDWPQYHLIVSRLLPYKNVDKAVEAFRAMPDERLLIIGRGPMEASLRENLPSNVRIAGRVSDEELRGAYAGAHALLAPSYEDFGLTPLEAAAFGVPTLALKAGGYLDTIVEGQTGLYFDEVTVERLQDVVRRERAMSWDQETLRERARQFGEERFVEALRAHADAVLRG